MEDGDREGADSSGDEILFLVYRKLLSHAKVDCAHVIQSWVRDPHIRKDLPHGADVLFHVSFVDGIVVVCKDAHANLVSEDL